MLLADEQRLLLAALPLLPPEQRRVLELRLTGLPSTEVALILNRSPESVRGAAAASDRQAAGLAGDHGDRPGVSLCLTVPPWILDLLLDAYMDDLLADLPPDERLEKPQPDLAHAARQVLAIDHAPRADAAFVVNGWNALRQPLLAREKGSHGRCRLSAKISGLVRTGHPLRPQ